MPKSSVVFPKPYESKYGSKCLSKKLWSYYQSPADKIDHTLRRETTAKYLEKMRDKRVILDPHLTSYLLLSEKIKEYPKKKIYADRYPLYVSLEPVTAEEAYNHPKFLDLLDNFELYLLLM